MVEVILKVSTHTWVDDEYKKGEATQKLKFRDWDDFQSWLGYTTFARENETVSVDIKIVTEKEEE